MTGPVTQPYADRSADPDAMANGRAPAGEQSIGDLLGDVVGDVSRLFRKEVELAKVEMREEASKAGKAAGMMAAAGIAGLLAATMISLALAALLDEIMHPAAAALIVAVLWALAGAGLFTAGRTRMRQVNPVPQQAVESVKEDVRWLQNHNG
jgi:uncharacterized membrane protein YqjE